MAAIKGESKLTFLEATSIIIGHGVGSGILSVPYLAAHNSLREILLLLFVQCGPASDHRGTVL